MLKASIEKLGMKLVKRPLMKAGFIPKVTLATAEQAQDLVARGTIYRLPVLQLMFGHISTKLNPVKGVRCKLLYFVSKTLDL